MNDLSQQPVKRFWPGYRAVWRWHFYAGLFCIPFVLVLSVSGAIYLFKPQIEAWLERDFDNLEVAHPARISAQVEAALQANPAASLRGFELPRTPMGAGRVLLADQGKSLRVYVHPETLTVLATKPEDERLMRSIFRLHGELWLGENGSHLVELAASWTVVMVLTGLYLWWPRKLFGLAGMLYPRLMAGGKTFWRDMHAVTGVWISLFTLLLLLSGLPWSRFWGDYLKTVRRWTGTASARADWSNRQEPPTTKSASSSSGHGDHAQPPSARSRRGAPKPLPKDLTAFDRVAAGVAPLQLDYPIVINTPGGPADEWLVQSLTPNRPRRVNATLSGKTGELLKKDGFWDRDWIDRTVAVGIALHEGQLFGWANQLLGLLTAGGLVLVSASGIILWIRRRPADTLGAPRAVGAARFSWVLCLLVLALGVLLPLFGLSLLVVLLLERMILVRIPGLRDWLGLRESARPQTLAEAAT